MLKKFLISHFFIINLIFSSQVDQEFVSNLKKIKSAKFFYSKELKKIEDLILKGANVNIDVEGTTPLVIILDKYWDTYGNENELKILKMLIEHGANFNFRYRESSPLIKFCKCGNWEIVELMLKKGANPNYDPFGESPLINSSISVIKLLLQYGADPNIEYKVDATYRKHGNGYVIYFAPSYCNALQYALKQFEFCVEEIRILLHATTSLTNKEKCDLIYITIDIFGKFEGHYSDSSRKRLILFEVLKDYFQDCQKYEKFKKQFLNKISERLTTIDSNTLKLINSYCEINQIDWYLNYR